uniref:Uncharacterized protein LOC8259580 isoform X1 n=1 Tax=Rhizophora mucronata TaxID=61149 RepID=A0A2P2L1Y3_RHIMU
MNLREHIPIHFGCMKSAYCCPYEWGHGFYWLHATCLPQICAGCLLFSFVSIGNCFMYTNLIVLGRISVATEASCLHWLQGSLLVERLHNSDSRILITLLLTEPPGFKWTAVFLML